MSLAHILSLVAIITPVVTALLVFAFWLGKKFVGLELSQNSAKEDLKNYIKLFFNDERIAVEKRFDDIERVSHQIKMEVQSHRRKLKILEPKVDHIELVVTANERV